MDWNKVITTLRERADVAEANSKLRITNELAYQLLKEECRIYANLADALESGLPTPIPD